jgi:hypothetical protein
MRRLLIAMTTLAVLGAGFWIPATARPSTGPTDALTGGTATVVVGRNGTGGLLAWTTTVSGQFAAGGRTYSGTATGLADEDNPNGYALYFSGSSATGSIGASCFGNFAQHAGASDGGQSVLNPVGVLVESCSVSIDGAPDAGLQLVLALVPTVDPATFTGVFGALPDTGSLPSLPVLSFGSASATESLGITSADLTSYFSGQISIGGQTYNGAAWGTAPLGAGRLGVTTGVAPFQLTGTSATGSLSATCSGDFVTVGPYELLIPQPLGVGLSILTCDGSANGGSSGQTTLVSVYRVTGDDIHAGELITYEGAYAGI